MSRATLDRLLATRLEFEAKIAALLARIRGHAPNPEPPPDGRRRSAQLLARASRCHQTEPLDAKGRTACPQDIAIRAPQRPPRGPDAGGGPISTSPSLRVACRALRTVRTLHLAWIIREAICEILTRHAVGYNGVVSTAGLPAGFGAGWEGSGADRRLG